MARGALRRRKPAACDFVCSGREGGSLIFRYGRPGAGPVSSRQACCSVSGQSIGGWRSDRCNSGYIGQNVWQWRSCGRAKTQITPTTCTQRTAVLFPCLPNRACKVNSLLRFFAISLNKQRSLSRCFDCEQRSPSARSRLAFSRRGPCVPSRSAPGLSHALHQVRKQGCPSSPTLSSPKGGSRQEIADIPRFAAPPGGPRADL
jgi:hypothetical protein